MSDLIQGNVHQGTDTCVSIQGEKKRKKFYFVYIELRKEQNRRLHLCCSNARGKEGQSIFCSCGTDLEVLGSVALIVPLLSVDLGC